MGYQIKYIVTVVVLGALVFAGCTTQKEFRQQEPVKSAYTAEPEEDLTLYVATDLHYLSQSLTDHEEAFKTFVESGDGKQLDYIEEILDAFIY